MEDTLFLNDFADSFLADDLPTKQKGLRVFRNQPARIEIQVRATHKISPWSKGKEHFSFATVSLKKNEIEQLIDLLKSELDNL